MKLFLSCALLCVLAHNAPKIEAMAPVAAAQSINRSIICTICLDECDLADHAHEPRALPCGHVFHTPCIGTWVSRNVQKAACPVCRAEIQDLALINMLLQAVGVNTLQAEVPAAPPLPARAASPGLASVLPVPAAPAFFDWRAADWLGS